jgi:hypothetical protein
MTCAPKQASSAAQNYILILHIATLKLTCHRTGAGTKFAMPYAPWSKWLFVSKYSYVALTSV